MEPVTAGRKEPKSVEQSLGYLAWDVKRMANATEEMLKCLQSWRLQGESAKIAGTIRRYDADEAPF